jgi:hypothetical protein
VGSDALDEFEKETTRPARLIPRKQQHAAWTSGSSAFPEQEKSTVNKAIAGMMFLVAALVSLNASAASYTRSISSPGGLYQGDTLISQSGEYRMLLQSDGNLVVSRISDNALVWANYAYGTVLVVVQPDGNFVAYDTNGTAVWNTGTWGKAGTGSMPVRLYLEDNGALTLYNTSGSLIWSTPGVQPPAYCGDGVCGSTESPYTCSRDCGGYCGDGICGLGEYSSTCPSDCRPYCGDNICSFGETAYSCAFDCGSYCGNYRCDLFENRTNCPGDCPF